jgi:general nucleoside transport system ATP-binding protein
MSYHVELKKIVKRFPGGVLANDQVDLAVRQGEIHAIVGENGAGKSTLMKILYGLYAPDEGEIYVHGKPVIFKSPLDSIETGIGMVHQHFMLFPSLTVTENIVFGAEPTRNTLVDREAGRQRIRALSEKYDLRVDPERRVSDLPVGVQQRVEILKALYRDADLLILDEPTAVLTPQERDGLFRILRTLVAEGKSIIFITHKLNEVMEISDRATVLRNGKATCELEMASTSPQEICSFMVGREVLLRVEKGPAKPGATVLEVRDLSLRDGRGVPLLQEVSFSVRAGEIVGVAGVAGNGQEELIEALTGLRPVDSGEIRLKGHEVTRASVDARRGAGLSYIPEDRMTLGLALDASISENLILGFQRTPRVTDSRGLLRMDRVRHWANEAVRNFGIKAASVADPVRNLSGGNMQKVILAREFSHDSPLIIAEQPTRGVDVGAIEQIHRQLVAYRDQGHAILLVSADLNEILSLSDRIVVMFAGTIIGEMAAAGATEQQLGLLMAGVVPEREERSIDVRATG